MQHTPKTESVLTTWLPVASAQLEKQKSSSVALVPWVSGLYCSSASPDPDPVKGEHSLNLGSRFPLFACLLLLSVVLPHAFMINMYEDKLLSFKLYINGYHMSSMACYLPELLSFTQLMYVALFISRAGKYHCLNIAHFIYLASCQMSRSSSVSQKKIFFFCYYKQHTKKFFWRRLPWLSSG